MKRVRQLERTERSVIRAQLTGAGRAHRTHSEHHRLQALHMGNYNLLNWAGTMRQRQRQRQRHRQRQRLWLIVGCML